jgi:hypothetical protein
VIIAGPVYGTGPESVPGYGLEAGVEVGSEPDTGLAAEAGWVSLQFE